MNKYVFISYSSVDEKIVNHLLMLFRDNRFTYWKAPEMIPAGANYAKVIPAAIKECAAFVLLLSKNSQSSIWVEKEIDCAINNKKMVIPIAIDSEPLNDMIKFYLNNVQVIPYYKDANKAQISIKNALSQIYADNTNSTSSINVIDDNQSNNKIGENATSAGKIAPGSVNGLSVNQPTLTPGMMRKIKKEEDIRKLSDKKDILNERERQLNEKRKRWSEISNKDAFDKIKRLLDARGPMQVDEIYYETGIPKDVIKEYIRAERLEIPSNMPALFLCEKCGKKIRTGYLCSECKSKSINKPYKKDVFYTK